MKLLARLFGVLASFGTATIVLLLLLLLTWLGTLEQVEFGLYETQKKYFESLFLVHEAGPFAVRLPWSSPADGPLFTIPAFPVPLPGAYLLMVVLAVNLVCGGMIRLRKDWRRAGILITHFGIALMLLSGMVKTYFAHEGSLRIDPRQTNNVYQSYHDWDLTVRDGSARGRVRELVLPDSQWRDLEEGGTRRFTHDALPFDLLVTKAFRNCRVVQKGPMFKGDGPVIDGYVVVAQPPELEAEFNVCGLYVTAIEKAGGRQTDGIVWGMQEHPLTVEAGGKPWLIDLGKRRYQLPFDLRLDDFIVEFHPRTSSPRTFWSAVTKIEDGQEQQLKITMNEPLRHGGFVLFQTNWGPQTRPLRGPFYSVFTVVENPSDQWPKWSCYVISIGMLLHFSLRLKRWIASSRKPAAAPSGAAARPAADAEREATFEEPTTNDAKQEVLP